MCAVFGLYMHGQSNCFLYYVIQKFSPYFGLRSDQKINFPYCAGINRTPFKYQCPDHPLCFVLLFVVVVCLFVLFFFLANLNFSCQAI